LHYAIVVRINFGLKLDLRSDLRTDREFLSEPAYQTVSDTELLSSFDNVNDNDNDF